MQGANAQKVDSTQRLAKLRELMSKKDNSVNAIVVPSQDQHNSEYIAHCDQRRAFISGFDGSAGCAVITLDRAYLFTDGRYYLQAEKQLDENWTLMREGLPDVPTWQNFLAKNLDEGTRIGIDPSLIRAVDAQSLEQSLGPRKSKLVSLKENLVDKVWGDSRPPRPKNKVFALDVKYSGETLQAKLVRLREELSKKTVKALVVNILDEIAWLFNLRGSDIDYNPLFFAYAVVTDKTATVFVDESQIDNVIREHLGKDVELSSYESFFQYLEGLGSKLGLTKDTRALIGDRSSLAIAEAIGKDNYTIDRSPVTDLKAIKNVVEIEGFRQCHIRDGAALTRYFAWLEEQLQLGQEVTESGGAHVLEKYRSSLPLYQGLSFSTISSTGPNGAIIHYEPDPINSDVIKRDQIYLCDSGGQYLDGTTDVTRTWHFGTPTAEEKRAFTLVLQGHIAIDTAIFPIGTSGFTLDSWARRALWSNGLDYRHGTGHGVGHFLSVHEGPQGMGTRISYNDTPLKAGMTLSNEPGFYADGKFGIRIEDVVIVREIKTPNNFGGIGYLGFENLTMCPIQTRLVEKDLLTGQEQSWLNAYHAKVLDQVLPLLQNDNRATDWLRRECSPI